MSQTHKIKLWACGILACLTAFIWISYAINPPKNTTNTAATSSTSKKNSKTTTTIKKADTSSSKNLTVNWRKSSEDKAYPTLSNYPNAWLDVNIAKQRVYIRSANNQVLYTMYCSTGANNGTPRGTYYIQAERGLHFYNASEQEGANYYVSWLNHGEYLFHTVPVDANGNYITSVANNIGKKASSHGCVQLTIPDAQWIYNNVPYGMKVYVH